MKYIVLDTNILFIDYDKNFHVTELFFSRAVHDLLKMSKEERLGDDTKILIPEVVVRELISKKIEDFNKFEKHLEKMRKCITGCGTVLISIDRQKYPESVKTQFNEWMEINNVGILPICNNTYFNYIIEDAIEKKPPFEGKEKKSDKGFKDTLILYSMIAFAKENPGEYVLWTQDGLFKGNAIRDNVEYFAVETRCKLKVINKLEDIVKKEKKEQPEYIDNVGVKYMDRVYVYGKTSANPTVKITHFWPIILGEYDIVDKINNEIEGVCKSDLVFWNGFLDELDINNEGGFFGELSGKVTYNANGLLGIKLIRRHCLGGVANPEQFGKVYDLNKGCLLDLEKLLGRSEQEIISIIIQKQKVDSEKFPNKYWSDFVPRYKTADEIKYYIDTEGLHIFFDTYEASCGADGNVEFMLLEIGELLNSYKGSEELQEFMEGM